jgi:hypothetical protein
MDKALVKIFEAPEVEIHLASYLGDCHSVIFYQPSNHLRSHRRQPAPTAPTSQFPLAILRSSCTPRPRHARHFGLPSSLHVAGPRASASLRMRSTNPALPNIRSSVSSCPPRCRWDLTSNHPQAFVSARPRPAPVAAPTLLPLQQTAGTLFRLGILPLKLCQKALAVLPGVGLRS